MLNAISNIKMNVKIQKYKMYFAIYAGKMYLIFLHFNVHFNIKMHQKKCIGYN